MNKMFLIKPKLIINQSPCNRNRLNLLFLFLSSFNRQFLKLAKMSVQIQVFFGRYFLQDFKKILQKHFFYAMMKHVSNEAVLQDASGQPDCRGAFYVPSIKGGFFPCPM